MYPACMMQVTRDSQAGRDARPSTPVFLPRISTERRYSRGLAMSFAATSASCTRKVRKLRSSGR
jgi:hypothetical protein